MTTSPTHCRLLTSGRLDDPEQLLHQGLPTGFRRLEGYRMAMGDPSAELWPAEATVALREQNPGIRLDSLLANLLQYLTVREELMKVIKAACPEVPIEYLPFKLLDHRQRIHAADCYLINPLGSLDCLDLEASGVTYEEGEVVSIDRLVLSPRKLEQAPQLFRIREEPGYYVVGPLLAAAMRAPQFTNVVLEPLELGGR